MAMSYPPVEPTPEQFVRGMIDRSQGRVSVHGGETRCRVIHQTHRTVEFEGVRDAGIAFVERAWWRAQTAPSPPEESQGQDYAVALAFDHWDDGVGGWQPDRILTDAVLHNHLGG